MAEYVSIGYWINGYAEGDMLGGADSLQSNSCSAVALAVTKLLTSLDSSSSSTSSSNSITLIRYLTSDNVVQLSQTTVGAAVEIHNLNASPAAQIPSSSSVLISIVKDLTSANSTQDSTSSSVATGVTKSLTVLSVTQDASTTINAVEVRHNILSSGNIQSNSSSTGIILVTKNLTSAVSTQVPTSSSETISLIRYLTSEDSNNTQLSSSSAILIERATQILFDNLLHNAALSTTSTQVSGFPIANLKSNKGQVFRVNGNTSNIRMSWTTPQTIKCIAIPFSNLSSNATITVIGYSDNSFTDQVFSSGAVRPILTNVASTPVSKFQRKQSPIFRVLISRVSNIRSVSITITDTSLSNIDISTIVCGDTWSPTYGINFGVNMSINKTDSNRRTQAGNTYTDKGHSIKNMSIPINTLSTSDRSTLIRSLQKVGTSSPILVLAFPSSDDINKEYLYQIYGTISGSATISNSTYFTYATSLTIEEA